MAKVRHERRMSQTTFTSKTGFSVQPHLLFLERSGGCSQGAQSSRGAHSPGANRLDPLPLKEIGAVVSATPPKAFGIRRASLTL
jgi:hypothetical protein